jgi:hypothetical protein
MNEYLNHENERVIALKTMLQLSFKYFPSLYYILKEELYRERILSSIKLGCKLEKFRYLKNKNVNNENSRRN